MTLTDYVRILQRRWRIIALATLAGLAAAAAGVLLAEKSYDATATLRVATGLTPGDSVRLDSVEYADRLMNTYRELALSRPLRRSAARGARQAELPAVVVEIPANTELMDITVRAGDPRLAAREANLVAGEVVRRARESAGRRAASTEQAFVPRLEALQDEVIAARRELRATLAAGGSAARVAALRERAALADDAHTRLLEESVAAQSAATSGASTVSVEQAATPPDSPSRPRRRLTLALGGLLGLIGGIGLAFLGQALDRRVYARDEPLELAGVAVLAEIPKAPRQPIDARALVTLYQGVVITATVAGACVGLGLALLGAELTAGDLARSGVIGAAVGLLLGLLLVPLKRRFDGRAGTAGEPGEPAAIYNSDSPEREAFAILRTNLAALDGNPAGSTVLITSAEPGAGKTTVAANLGVAIARGGSRVALVDADFRHPTLHRVFGLGNMTGLSALLASKHPDDRELLSLFTRETGVPHLSLLTAGPSLDHPGEWLESGRMERVITSLRKTYDVVIIDTPALLSVSDAAGMVSLADSVLLVVREAHTTLDAVRDAREQLEAVRARTSGVVVNCGKRVLTTYYTRRRDELFA